MRRRLPRHQRPAARESRRFAFLSEVRLPAFFIILPSAFCPCYLSPTIERNTSSRLSATKPDCRGVLTQIIHASLKQQPPVVENPNVICNQFDFRQHMGRDQHRAVVKAGQGFYQIADFVDTRRVKTVCGFVQNQNRRTPQERPGKAQALLHSQRILFCQPVAKLGQPLPVPEHLPHQLSAVPKCGG